MEVITGDGRLVRSGARTVKSVTGYDLHKLMTGSLGTLGVIVQVALKVRPRPQARRSVRAAGGVEMGRRLLDAVPSPAAVLAMPEVVELRLEGWPEEVERQVEATDRAAGVIVVTEDGVFPSERPWETSAVVAEAAVPGSPRSSPRVVGRAARRGDRLGRALIFRRRVGRPPGQGQCSRRDRARDQGSRRAGDRRSARTGGSPKAEGRPRPGGGPGARPVLGRDLTWRTPGNGAGLPSVPSCRRGPGSSARSAWRRTGDRARPLPTTTWPPAWPVACASPTARPTG